MANEIRNGSGLNNVSETWDANERKNLNDQNSGGAEDVPAASELDRVVREEATEYDQTSSDEKLQGGDRATVRDDDNS
jgi:hypothetical protein